ncbi:MAG: PolC-type DNA polymerase III, partial [Eubacterium sp.]
MNPIIHKQDDLKKLIEKYSLKTQRVEVNAQNKELIFTFKSLIPECDNLSIQRELSRIFDFTKSLSVVIQSDSVDKKTAPLKEIIHKRMEEGDYDALAKKKEETLKKRLSTIKDIPPAKAASAASENGSTESVRELTVGEAVLGERIKRHAQPMGEIDFSVGATLDSTSIVIAGRIFGVDSREITDKTTLFVFNITDEQGSVSCKIFAR